jgi:hypothetical protein
MSTFGPAYDAKKDEPAITDQRNLIKALMVDGKWRTLFEIHAALNYPEASVSAQLRHLRKPQFGGWLVCKKRRLGQRVWEYRLTPSTPDQIQVELFPKENKTWY